VSIALLSLHRTHPARPDDEAHFGSSSKSS
jgi:hypothetical protein